MTRVVVIGAGLSGCTTACTLADHGVNVALVEKSNRIGGKVRSYGCKAIESCQNCGVCLTAGLWDKVSSHNSISVLTCAEVKEITGSPGDYTVNLISDREELSLSSINAVVVCTGFESRPGEVSAHLHITGTSGLMTGTRLEELMLSRTRTGLFEKAPKSIAFIQCTGSRDINEGGLYCSKVCCSYSTRAARVIRSYYPDCEIVFFYMELQSVEAGDCFAGLCELGMEFIKCRPAKIVCGKQVEVEYDDPAAGITNRMFDLVVLSDGIHAAVSNDKLAEVCGLGQDKDGFLRAVDAGSGIYVAGCARAPMKIDETCADSIAAAGMILR